MWGAEDEVGSVLPAVGLAVSFMPHNGPWMVPATWARSCCQLRVSSVVCCVRAILCIVVVEGCGCCEEEIKSTLSNMTSSWLLYCLCTTPVCSEHFTRELQYFCSEAFTELLLFYLASHWLAASVSLNQSECEFLLSVLWFCTVLSQCLR